MAQIKDELRSVVMECLKKRIPCQVTDVGWDISQLSREIAKIAKERDLKYGQQNAWTTDQQQSVQPFPSVLILVRDTVWDMIFEGILRPGTIEHHARPDKHQFPYFHVTAFGEEVLNGSVDPYDPEGYLKLLQATVPNADPVITTYISESAHTLRANCLLSSTVTLGCASEKALLVLIDAYIAALDTADSAQFKKEVEKGWMIKPKYDAFMSWFKTKLKASFNKHNVPSNAVTQYADALDLLIPYFRDIRNSVGHPNAVAFTRDRVHSHLVVFPAYVRSIYDLIQWMESNKPL